MQRTKDTRARRPGVELEYARLVERHRDELHAHSRRIVRSPEDAEDAVQEALVRAWRALPGFEGRSSLRSWLYRIVTNASLDEVKRRPQRVVPIDLHGGRDDLHARAAGPATEGRYLTREDFERALIVAMRVLPPRQRAVLILREALGFSARETAIRLDTTVAAANSSLQRARAALREAGDDPGEETARSLNDRRLRERVERHAEAWEREDVRTLVKMLAADAGS
ncbi:MAG TPA: sigma-70 family RNA polymerase sigma factor [Solirubrobacterales bacterium]|jgi:RNA polymerase sigma-70 factor (ECF subfamily)